MGWCSVEVQAVKSLETEWAQALQGRRPLRTREDDKDPDIWSA